MSTDSKRQMSTLGATSVGVGAIVGGGILALSGVGFASAGPSAILAFALNGVIAVLTALSFAEMATRFPRSGGTYIYAKLVLSIESAFLVGWVVWFASIVAAVLYAVGFGQFAAITLVELAALAGWQIPTGMTGRLATLILALLATGIYTLDLLRESGDWDAWINITKVAVFGVLIAVGASVSWGLEPSVAGAQLQPFFAFGLTGLIQAMGFTFIALQGFDLIAAVAGEVKDPQRALPRAMLGSLGIALAVYLPLLLVLCLVGVAPGGSIAELGRQDPAALVAVAARRFIGPLGYWLVLGAGVLSMASALRANLFAASRIVQSMARDRALPAWIGRTTASGIPRGAVLLTCGLVAAICCALGEIAAAGAAASLIFLVTFTLAHWIAILMRMRGSEQAPGFRAPLFPLVPVTGGLACLALAIFQALAVPFAGAIVLAWLIVGLALFLILFARHARITDDIATARDPEAQALRGLNPLVLVPVANPQRAAPLVALGGMLTPSVKGRVLVHSIVVAPPDWDPAQDRSPVESATPALVEAMVQAQISGVRVEALTTIAPSPWVEITRVARLHRCETVLVGLSQIDPSRQEVPLDLLLGLLDANVVAARADPSFRPHQVKRILVPMGARLAHHRLRASLLGSLLRLGAEEVIVQRILPPGAPAATRAETQAALTTWAEGIDAERVEVRIDEHDDPVAAVAAAADQADLVILGVVRSGSGSKLFGTFTPAVAARTRCPLIVISERG